MRPPHRTLPPPLCRLSVGLLTRIPGACQAGRAVWPQKSPFPSLFAHDSKLRLRKTSLLSVERAREARKGEALLRMRLSPAPTPLRASLRGRRREETPRKGG